MPSPFVGMDPYLEEPERWADVHNSVIVFTMAQIQRQLPEPYFASSDRRTRIEYPEWYDPDIGGAPPSSHKDFLPDVLVGAGAYSPEDAAVATLEDPDGAVIVQTDWAEDPGFEVSEPYLEIYTRQGKRRRLVTSIEVLSPANKSPKDGEQYRTKQRETLQSEVHLLEIDLLRAGRHSTSVPRDALRSRVGDFDYHVCLSRFDARRRHVVWPVRLGERLPDIQVPLLPDDGWVSVKLQDVLDATYEAGPFAREVDYAEPPPPPEIDPERLAAARRDAQRARSVGE